LVFAQESAWAKKKVPLRESSSGPAYQQREEAMAFANEIASRQDLDASWVRRQIERARFNKKVQQLMSPAPTGFQKNWQVYKSRFIEPRRIAAGVQFWGEHAATLARAESEYGVPAQIIVGILGVETIYGRDTGQFRVIDALSTLAFDFPVSHPRAAERQAYFRSELEQFLLMTHKAGTNPLSLRGSYAGAMGWPQFMPSSWLKFAVDFDGDGHIDLFNSVPDIIGSVAHYFQKYGWQTGMSTHHALQFSPDLTAEQKTQLLLPDILPTFTASAMQANGVLLNEVAQKHSGKLALVELKNGDDAPQYVAGTENFYVITRYNWSAYYAMAVIELGQAVQTKMSAPQ
jgi:membrane-bound lytic murein transglycosylase B